MRKEIIANATGGIIATVIVALSVKLVESKIALRPLSIPVWILVAILTWTCFVTFRAIKLRTLIGSVKHAKIAVISYSFSSSFFFDDLLREIIDTCNTNNLNLELKLPVNDFNNSDFKRLLKKSLDESDEFSSAIIITSNIDENIDALKDFEKKFNKPIVLLDAGNSKSIMQFTDKVSLIGFSNQIGGQKAAEIAFYYLNALEQQQAQIFVIASELQCERQDCFEKGIRRLLPDARVSINSRGAFNRKAARKIAYNYLMKNPSTNLVFCTNDEMALGVVDAIELIKQFDFTDLVVIGYDGIEEVVEEINSCNSVIRNTILQDRKHLAHAAVECIVKKIERKPVLKEFIVEPEIFVPI